MRRILVLLLVGAVGALGGCGRTLKTSAYQANPLTYPADTLRESRRLHIDTKDIELPSQFRLRQSAYFAVVSRDRLRFHVTVVHKWEEMADIRGWNVWLEDDRGRVFQPSAKEKRSNKHLADFWEREMRSATYNAFGDVVKVANDGWRRRLPFEAVDVFRGQGDYVFFAPGLFDARVKQLTLHMERNGITYVFAWNFVQAPEGQNPYLLYD